MKKRILSILLTLCMVLCLAPVGVFAEGETTKKVETEQELVDALADSTVDVIKLGSDIAVSSTLTVERAVTLDIYGYMLEMKGNGSVITVEDNGHLTLKDSDPTATYKFTPDANGLWKWGTSGTETVHGGVIYGGTGTDWGDFTLGGGVYVKKGGQFTMNGGNIVGCTATGQNTAYGGGVCLYGRFTMNGGNIIGCTAAGDRGREPISYGGGVYVTGIGTFIMTGGSITDCTATSGYGMFACGGGIYNIGDTTLSGTAEIRDCHVKATVGMYGGGIHDGDGTLKISGDVKVSGCTAGGQGSDAVHIFKRCTISGGTFYGSVTNWGTISGGTFYGGVTDNYGTITGGTFYGGITNVENRGKIDGLTVTYRVNGADYATQILRSGAAATRPDDPATEEGYVFAGWFNGDTVHDFTSPVTGDIILTAKWTKIADKTADFTASDGGAEAIALLNSAKTGSKDSIWDNGTKTLTLRGICFATTVTTAVKLPDGAKVILADGTENRFLGGDAAVTQSGKHENQIYIYGIHAAGALTIQGETKGTGRLFVNSGEHTNGGNAWTYSAALYADGDLTVKSGAVTAQGGKTSSADCAFSYGVQLSEGHSLSVSGGTLTGIGGESYNTRDPNNSEESFSEGVDIYRGNVTISGSGKLNVETVSDMMEKELSFGLYIIQGSLFVSDSAALTAKTCHAIDISGGDLKLSGGKICSYATFDDAAISVTRDHYNGIGNANIEITGGEIECAGGIYMSASSTAEGMGILSVTGGKLTAGSIYGSDRLTISDSTVVSGRINANTVELQSGSLTVRQPVYKNEYTGDLYASYAIYCKKLAVSGGVLEAAWDWGEYTPIVFPPDSYWGYAIPLVRIDGGTAAFSGGTVTFDTGCAGNTVFWVDKLELTGGVVGSGYTREGSTDFYKQTDGATAVKFAVYPADYTRVNAAIDKANALNKDDYKDFSAVEAAINAVVRDKNIDEQEAVDAMAKAIEDAIAALEYKDADYSAVNAAIEKANALQKEDYKDFSAVQAAVDAVVWDKDFREQETVDAMAKAIEDAIAALEYKDADYSAVNAAIDKANALQKDDYKDFSAVQAAIDAVVWDKDIREQEAVDAMAKAIEDAIAALEKKPAAPKTGDSGNTMRWVALLLISGGAGAVLTKRRRNYDETEAAK